MNILTVSKARANLYHIVDETAHSHEPAIITSKRANVVLIAEDDWAAITETLHLVSIPGMRESIKKGLETSVEECATELDW